MNQRTGKYNRICLYVRKVIGFKIAFNNLTARIFFGKIGKAGRSFKADDTKSRAFLTRASPDRNRSRFRGLLPRVSGFPQEVLKTMLGPRKMFFHGRSYNFAGNSLAWV